MAREAARPRHVRLIAVPACLFLGVSATVVLLAQLSLAEPGPPKAAGEVTLGDAYRGQIVYAQSCAGCHGESGEGGAGPALAGSTLGLAAVKAQIERGGGTMPPGLVRGRQLDDVLAHVATLLAAEGESR